MKKAGVILVNYKDYAERFLTECRDSLRAQVLNDLEMVVIIVDNASTPETLNYLRNEYPEAVTISRSDGNYASANNAGIAKALELDCDYFVIANMDTRFDENWLSNLVKVADSDDKIGIVQSKIYLYPKNDIEWKCPKINSLGNLFHYLGFGFTQGYNEIDCSDIQAREIEGYASGCSLLMKKSLWQKIGGYNEEFYMYHDDLELGWRAKLAGYKIYLAPNSVVYHKYEFQRSARMIYFQERNRYLSIFTFYRIPTILLIMPMLLILQVAMVIYALTGGWITKKLKADLYFLKPGSWRKIWKFRKQVKKIRVLSDREAIKNFQGKVLFQEINNPVLEKIGNPLMDLYWDIVKKIIFW